MTLWGVLVISQNGKDLRGRNQCKPLLNTRVKPLTPTNPAQLFPNFSCRHFCANDDKNGKKWHFLTKKIRLESNFWPVFGHVWTGILMLVHFPSTLSRFLDILRAKKFICFSPDFSPVFTPRPTSESYNNPLKVLTKGSMVEYLPVGSQEAPQTIIGKKNFQPSRS